MPELPEVETIISDLRNEGLENQVILKAAVHWERSIAYPSASEFCSYLIDKKILSLSRRAKFLIFSLTSNLFLIVHLRMSGRFFLSKPRERDRHEHVEIFFKDGRVLYFHDTRKFGRFYLTSSPEDIFSNIGPEPLDPAFSFKEFSQRLLSTRRKLKSLLLDQNFLAGLGNIYVDEALWEAQIHPERINHSLTQEEQKALFLAIQTVLRQGIENGGTSLGKGKGNFKSLQNPGDNQHHLKVFKRAGGKCYRCRQKIIRIITASRGSHLCPYCQKFTS